MSLSKEQFEEVMKIPTYSEYEDMMQEYLVKWASQHGCSSRKDGKGNIYLTKGSSGSGFYPGFINHIDTVHEDQKQLVEQEIQKDLVWSGNRVTAVNPLTEKQTGLGMDDQGGCALALAAIDELPCAKALFCVEEEIGMQGSRAADMSFFDDCAFVFSNDSPDRDRGTHYSSGVQLYSDQFFSDFLQSTCSKHGLTSFKSEPYTDIIHVRKHVLPNGKHLECFNFGNGGYDEHSSKEYAKWNDVQKASKLLVDLCKSIPLDVQHASGISEEPLLQSKHGTMYKANPKDCFADIDPWEYGEFNYSFQSDQQAEHAAEELQKIKDVVGYRLFFKKSNKAIQLDAEMTILMYACMICFNAENNTSYTDWKDFQKAVPYAVKVFQKIVMKNFSQQQANESQYIQYLAHMLDECMKK